MQVAVPIWNGRVSPVFDSAQNVLVVRVENGREINRKFVQLNGRFPLVRARELADQGIDVLICGAISRPLVVVLCCAGVRVVDWVAGEAEQVIHAFLQNTLDTSSFWMPGRGGAYRHGWGHERVYGLGRPRRGYGHRDDRGKRGHNRWSRGRQR